MAQRLPLLIYYVWEGAHTPFSVLWPKIAAHVFCSLNHLFCSFKSRTCFVWCYNFIFKKKFKCNNYTEFYYHEIIWSLLFHHHQCMLTSLALLTPPYHQRAVHREVVELAWLMLAAVKALSSEDCGLELEVDSVNVSSVNHSSSRRQTALGSFPQ